MDAYEMLKSGVLAGKLSGAEGSRDVMERIKEKRQQRKLVLVGMPREVSGVHSARLEISV